MFSYILAGIIGVVIWQLVVSLFCLFSDKNKDRTIVMSMGIVGVFFVVVIRIINKIKLEWYKRNLVAFHAPAKHVLQNGSIIYDSSDTYYMTKKMKNTLKCDNRNRVANKTNTKPLWSLQFFNTEIKSAPHKSEIWKGEKEFHKIDMTQFM